MSVLDRRIASERIAVPMSGRQAANCLIAVSLVLSVWFISFSTEAATRYGSKAGEFYCATSTGSRDPSSDAQCDSNGLNVILEGVNISDSQPFCNSCLPENGWIHHSWELNFCYPASRKSRKKGIIENCLYLEKYTRADSSASLSQSAWVYKILTDTCGPNEILNPNIGSFGACIPKPKSQNNVGCSITPNPIDPIVGAKIYRHTDFVSLTNPSLTFVRHYNSLGSGWKFSYSQSLNLFQSDKITIHREDSDIVTFSRVEGLWMSDSHTNWTLEEISTPSHVGYEVKFEDTVERYNTDGWLVSIKTRSGSKLDISYTPNQILVKDGFNNNLIIEVNYPNKELGSGPYDSPQLVSLTLPDSSKFKYLYKAKNLIEYVQSPDDTSLPGGNPFSEDNKYMTYVYGHGTNEHLITSVLDENQIVISEVIYDAYGRPTSSVLASGIDAFTVDYRYQTYTQGAKVSVTNPLGKTKQFNFDDSSGRRMISSIQGNASPNCNSSNHAFSYYPSGHVNSGLLKEKTDAEGSVTRFEYNVKGQEIKKIEAAGTSEQRITLSEWHTNFNVITKVITSKDVTEYVYDTEGRLLSSTSTSAAP